MSNEWILFSVIKLSGGLTSHQQVLIESILWKTCEIFFHSTTQFFSMAHEHDKIKSDRFTINSVFVDDWKNMQTLLTRDGLMRSHGSQFSSRTVLILKNTKWLFFFAKFATFPFSQNTFPTNIGIKIARPRNGKPNGLKYWELRIRRKKDFSWTFLQLRLPSF